MDDDFEYH
jgi:hypothetical protein